MTTEKKTYNLDARLVKDVEAIAQAQATSNTAVIEKAIRLYHAKSALAITRTLIRQLAQNMSQTTTQNHTMGLTRHQKLRRAMKHKKELHEPLYP